TRCQSVSKAARQPFLPSVVRAVMRLAVPFFRLVPPSGIYAHGFPPHRGLSSGLFLLIYFSYEKKALRQLLRYTVRLVYFRPCVPHLAPAKTYRSRSLGGSAGILQPSSFAQAYPRKTATPLGFGCEHGRAPTRG
ncbi:hypothetical protein, partial [Microscilla marina]|uniref:hypothetical protein n=1 Tax=Microscilla marina TaxID=1027 RepID=UPI001E62A280